MIGAVGRRRDWSENENERVRWTCGVLDRDRGYVLRARCIFCAHGGGGDGAAVRNISGVRTERRVVPNPGGISERAVSKPNQEA